MEQNPLVGKIITAIHLSADKEAIRFDLEGGESITALCDADCCSHTWIENLETPDLAIGSPVLVAEDVELNKEPLENDEYECLKFYGFKIRTAKGEMLLDYRNSSNGYYGGSLSWPGEYHYVGVYGQNANAHEKWQKVA